MNFLSGISINVDRCSIIENRLPPRRILFHGMFRFYKIKSHAKQLGSVSFGKRNNGKRKKKKNKKDRGTKQEEEKIRRRE